MKKRVQLLTFALAAVMTMSLLVACTKDESSSSSSSQTSSGTTSSETTGGEGDRTKLDGVMYTEGLPIVDPGSYSFTLFVDDSQEDDDYVMFPILQEQTGVEVVLQKNPYEIAQEKLSIALTSGDYADCIGGWTLNQNMILTTGVEDGVFIPLEKMFEEYCPTLNRALNMPGVREIMETPDGHVYSVPYVLGAPEVAYVPLINTQWLKNVGMDMPTTVEEFEAVLKAFKEQDANGNGDPNDEIPFSGDPDNLHLGELCGWFGLSVASARNNNEGFTMVGGELTFGANTEEYKKGIEYLAGLYKQGLIDPELFTQDKGQWKAVGAQDKYGVVITYASSDIIPYDPGVVPAWEAVPVLKSEGVDKPVYLRDSYGSDVLKTQVVITDNAKNPEVIARWWDNLYEYENTLQTQHGPLGITLFEENGVYTKVDISKMSDADQKEYSWGNLWPQSLPKFDPDNGYRVTEENPMYEEKPPIDALYGPSLTEVIPPYWASSEAATRITDLQTAISEYVRQKRAEWISGQADINAEWDSYLAQLDKLKLDEYVQLRRDMIS